MRVLRGNCRKTGSQSQWRNQRIAPPPQEKKIEPINVSSGLLVRYSYAWFGVAVTAFVASTKLSYVESG